MRRVLLMTAAIVVAVIFFLLLTLPPRPASVTATIAPDIQSRTVAGVYHIHSTRSDGAAGKDEIAAAAARAGLAFIILTDHGDGMRTPDPPAYLHGVLCLDAVEISTNGGHYVALDMQPSPYPLGGEPSAVVEDVRRLGGFGIVAHPDSPKTQLAWTDWNAPFDGIEWLNADSEWRDESRARLAKVLFDYFLRPAPALASMLDRPVTTLRRWDELTAHRRVVGLAGVDAHGGIGRGMEEGGKRRAALGTIPSYEASFRTFSTRARLEHAFTRDAASDAKTLLAAIRSGRVFTVIDAIASPGFIGIDSNGPGRSTVDVTMPGGGELIMVRGGHDSDPLRVDPSGHYVFTTDGMSGPVRFEVRVPGAPGTPPVPWLVSNPIYFVPARDTEPPPSLKEDLVVPLGADASWHVEKDPGSAAATTAEAGGVRLEYTLDAGSRHSQFAAAVTDFQDRGLSFRALTFSVAAARPARVSVQLRYASGGGERWAHSVYADSTPRTARVSIDRLAPVDLQRGPAPDPSTARSLLFVIDLTNARPGDSNSIRISDVRFVR
jgi:hypothetical protein